MQISTIWGWKTGNSAIWGYLRDIWEKISYFQKKDQRMNKSKFEVKIFLLPENFAFKLVSARRTEASGRDERTLWGQV